jgi:hypothetical protein
MPKRKPFHFIHPKCNTFLQKNGEKNARSNFCPALEGFIRFRPKLRSAELKAGASTNWTAGPRHVWMVGNGENYGY